MQQQKKDKIKKLDQKSSGLDKALFNKLKRLDNPIKIQNFLDQMPINYEKQGETIMSPKRSMSSNKCHCLEGAMLGALALWINGERPLLLDLGAEDPDVDHVIALYKRNGFWGAISKTNHATIRFRDPVYKSFRELAMSYFHEWFMDKNGRKTMRTFSFKALDLSKFDKKWITEEADLQYISDALDKLPHQEVVTNRNIKYLRKADKMERKAGGMLEWSITDPRT